MEEPQEQPKFNHADHLKPWQFKPGQSGNPGGKPKGTVSLKEYARKMLQEMDEEEKLEFMKGLDKDKVWEMAEGKAHQDTNLTGEITQRQYIITRGEDKLQNLPEGSPEVPITDKTD